MGPVCSSGPLFKSLYPIILSCSCSASKKVWFLSFRTVPEEPMTIISSLPKIHRAAALSCLQTIFPTVLLSLGTFPVLHTLALCLQVANTTRWTATSTVFERAASSPSCSSTKWHPMPESTWDGCWGRILIVFLLRWLAGYLCCSSVCSDSPFGCWLQNCIDAKMLTPSS